MHKTVYMYSTEANKGENRIRCLISLLKNVQYSYLVKQEFITSLFMIIMNVTEKINYIKGQVLVIEVVYMVVNCNLTKCTLNKIKWFLTIFEVLFIISYQLLLLYYHCWLHYHYGANKFFELYGQVMVYFESSITTTRILIKVYSIYLFNLYKIQIQKAPTFNVQCVVAMIVQP